MRPVLCPRLLPVLKLAWQSRKSRACPLAALKPRHEHLLCARAGEAVKIMAYIRRNVNRVGAALLKLCGRRDYIAARYIFRPHLLIWHRLDLAG